MSAAQPESDALDEATHRVGPERTFNESMYVHVWDENSRIGGFVRVANRPNEGRGEATVCLFLPDGTLAFAFDRPGGSDNLAMRGGGVELSVEQPMQRLRATFSGAVSLLHDPDAMIEPRSALCAASTATCELDWSVVSTAAPFRQCFDSGAMAFAPNHYELLVHVTGSVRVDGRVFEIDGHGVRDHSWGPRSWQAPWFYRWLHGSSSDLGFMAAYFGSPEGEPVIGGFVCDGGTLVAVAHVSVETDREPDTGYPHAVRVTLGDPVTGRRWTFAGSVQARVPLRNRARAGGATTRILECVTAWTADDGRVLHGMSEYLDQIVDGRAVGEDI